MADDEAQVDLGFVEKPSNSLRITSPFFPSKVGGKPAWLNLEDLPNSEVLSCRTCRSPMCFLLQVYAPLSEGPAHVVDRCFHRTIFIFCCKNGKCYKKNSNEFLIALRSQLPRKNSFYSLEAPPDDESVTWDTLSAEFKPRAFVSLCDVCGCLGDKKCSKCHDICYCCRDHQVIGWKAGHKHVCSKTDGKSTEETQGQFSGTTNKLLFPEFEIVTEPEPPEAEAKERSEKDRMQDFEKMKRKFNDIDLSGKEDKELEKLAMTGKQDLVADKQFKIFKKRVARQHEQVLRYDRGGQPLWVSREHQPHGNGIPKCSCGAERTFEFQIMPQLLNYLGVDSVHDSIDWGTIAVYTCTENCDDGKAYHEEFVWKQDFTDTGLPGNALLG